MKVKIGQVVPMPPQAVAGFRERLLLNGGGRWVFPSVRKDGQPMSENTGRSALIRLGYTGDEQTAHGFRHLSSTLLHEAGFPSDHIERHLAHLERDPVKAAYNAAQYLPQRRTMLRAWANYLDALRENRLPVLKPGAPGEGDRLS